MKKRTALLLAAIGIFVVGTLSISCAPTAPNSTNTTTLYSAPASVVLTDTNSTQASSVALSCGCPFPPSTSQPFTVTGYHDTSIVTFHFAEPLTKDTNIHTVIASIRPSALSGSGSNFTWVAFSYPENNYGTIDTLYDTLRVTANY